MLRFRAWRAGSTFDHRTLIKRESVLLDQLHSAVHAELTLLHSSGGMDLLVALLDRDLIIEHPCFLIDEVHNTYHGHPQDIAVRGTTTR